MQIVGSGWDPALDNNRVFLWEDGKFTLLPGPMGGALISSVARDISDAGQIVGQLFYFDEQGNGAGGAALWQNGQYYDLTELTINENPSDAWAINSHGVIPVSATQGPGVLYPIDSPPGDVDHNCRVNVDDLLLLLAQWGPGVSFADVNNDGAVNVTDLLTLLANWRP